MGALVTMDVPAGSPVLDLPWIITIGPLRDDEEWEQVVCGPYERAHALALAETVVADDELIAIVEPILPHVSADEIRAEIAAAQLAATDVTDEDYVDGDDIDVEAGLHHHHAEPGAPPSPAEVRAGRARVLANLATGA